MQKVAVELNKCAGCFRVKSGTVHFHMSGSLYASVCSVSTGSKRCSQTPSALTLGHFKLHLRMQHVPDIFTYLQSRALRASCSYLSKKKFKHFENYALLICKTHWHTEHTEHTQQFQVLRNLLFKWVTGSETNYG